MGCNRFVVALHQQLPRQLPQLRQTLIEGAHPAI